MQALRVSLVQSDLVWQNPTENLKNFQDKLLKLVDSTDLIVLPEMFTTGFSMDTSMAQKSSEMGIEWLKSMAQITNAHIMGSMMVKDDNKYFNRLVLASASGELEYYDKRHLFSYGHEDKHYTQGQKRLEVEINGWKICPLICYDLRFPVWARNNDEYGLLIYIANWPNTRMFAWNSLLPARAIENQSYVVGVNRIGSDGNKLKYSGGSVVYDYQGQKCLDLEGKAAVETIILEKDDLLNFRIKFPFLMDMDKFLLV